MSKPEIRYLGVVSVAIGEATLFTVINGIRCMATCGPWALSVLELLEVVWCQGSWSYSGISPQAFLGDKG